MKMALGTVQLGINYGVANKTGKPTTNEAFDILNKAYDNNIRLFDTAQGYNDSECIIGEFINTINPKDYLIATKTGSLFKRGVLASDLQKEIGQDISTSMDRLKVSEIDYYMLHNADDLFKYGKDIVKALVYYKEKGVIKKIGVSIYNTVDVNEILNYNEIDQIQIPFNILDTRLLQNGWDEKIKKNSIEVHGRSIYLQGLLTMEIKDIPQKLQSAKSLICQLDDLAKELSITRKELAFLYARDSELIDKMIIGCETKAQLQENIELYKYPPLPKNIYNKVLEYFSHISDKIINPTLW